MYQTLTTRLREALSRHIQQNYALTLDVVLEKPPKLEMGEAATPVCFELAKRLKRGPRQIAQEIVANFALPKGIARLEVAGGGYLNAFFDRAAFWHSAVREASGEAGVSTALPGKIIVEHTNINPNKAAHIGHLRNAVLGDTFVRLLRHAGHTVEVQNYIDNTGVQVADVVIGFLHMEKRTPADVRTLSKKPRFDYYCWDLYARVTHFFEEDVSRQALRGETLKRIEEGRGEEAEIAEVVADTVVACHLRTMSRLGVAYDLLPRESEILHLHFWDAAFAKLKETGAIQLSSSGKNAGCWVMPWKESSGGDAAAEDADAQAKIIVRSNGTVTYVGKDIAYQLWKFGLLGKDFHYARYPHFPEGATTWITTSAASDPNAPAFGGAATVYNVIDTRQAYLQQVVTAGLRALGHTAEADRSIHFAYEVVALSPRCARELGYELSPEDAKKPYVEVSGRKGLGVKADDLLDRLEAATLAEVLERHPQMGGVEQQQTAHAVAVSALRFFLLKFTRNAIIAFDFKDALSFEGETGPYCQYAVVRIRGIRRKGAEAGGNSASLSDEFLSQVFSGAGGDGLWEVAVLSGSLDQAVEAAIGAQEPAFLAKYAFQLAQSFNNFYHKHHILSEADAQKRAFLLRLTELVEQQLVRALDLMGIDCPEKM
ncbi:MAG TPA: arginine--tRNA ligase [Candidatus Acidoferrum sp.]|nr:arginine--tRNA ligase [Candidatus Acidoferrum sp.]